MVQPIEAARQRRGFSGTGRSRHQDQSRRAQQPRNQKVGREAESCQARNDHFDRPQHRAARNERTEKVHAEAAAFRVDVTAVEIDRVKRRAAVFPKAFQLRQADRKFPGHSQIIVDPELWDAAFMQKNIGRSVLIREQAQPVDQFHEIILASFLAVHNLRHKPDRAKIPKSKRSVILPGGIEIDRRLNRR